MGGKHRMMSFRPGTEIEKELAPKTTGWVRCEVNACPSLSGSDFKETQLFYWTRRPDDVTSVSRRALDESAGVWLQAG